MKKKILVLAVFIIMALSMLCGCEKKHGEFYTLQEAYDSGFITRDDLLSIAYYYHASHNPSFIWEYNGHLMRDDYQPIEKSPETLSKKTERAIKKTIIYDLKQAEVSAPLGLKNIQTLGYYGTYNGYVAVSMGYSYDGEYIILKDACGKYMVADVTFFNSAITHFFSTEKCMFDNHIKIWKEN